ncbi:uncharacterized protein Pyn_31878 [Prunus yedoensis var. nudiflora]|uniref:Uncharacterized protein n=1 Tax=Prunus yedoensis var. nudiflora TaxID=2094558 RepID=A0A314ZHB5_PRUYE|nr:uncharacterized protein Pyn_31878 [Prunus yedoensis var. nudiflora]
MADWGPVVIAVVLFVLLSPGLLFQLPGRGRVVEFGSMHTRWDCYPRPHHHLLWPPHHLPHRYWRSHLHRMRPYAYLATDLIVCLFSTLCGILVFKKMKQ